ncbi:MAG: thioredoxin family protein, partial [Acidobacteriota bacterium]
VGIVAAPCVGPFVFGLLTYVGNRGNGFLGFLLFFVLSLGMGLPRLILGLFSGSIRSLPRSGEWMVWVRKVFGFVLLAMAIFFLKTLFPHPLLYPFALALLFVLSGIYLAWIAPVDNSSRGFTWLRNLVGIGFFIAALFVAVTGLDAYLENAPIGEFNSQSDVESLTGAGRVQWIPFSEVAVQRASLEGKPVLIDFYADWCAQCVEYDRQTFSDGNIVELSRDFIMIKADFTEVGDPDVEALRKRYDVPSLPTLIFLKPDGSEIENLRAVGFEAPDVFGPRMEEALRISGNSLQPMENEVEFSR